MKTIYLIRHAESPWKKGEPDMNRTLSKKGKKDAITLSKQLLLKPDLIISSPAIRTKQTIIYFAKELNYDLNKIDFEINIYEAPLSNLIKKVNLIDNNNNTTLLIGHNPGITLLANYLTGDSLSPVEPCTTIKIELEIDNWNEIIAGIGQIVQILTP